MISDMDYKYIDQLLERYWAAETTLEEEKILRTFFSQADIPAELEKYQSLFAYESMAAEEKLEAGFDEKILSQTESPASVKARRITLGQRMMPLLRAAAIVAVILTLGNAIQKPFNSDNPNGNIAGMEEMDNGVSVALNVDSTTIDTMQQSRSTRKDAFIGPKNLQDMPEGKSSVGIKLDIAHISPSPVGIGVRATAIVTGISESGKIVDFKMTSMKSWHIALSYVLSAFFVGLVISAATLAVALIFMFSTGSSMPLTDVLLCILLLIPSTFSSAIIMFSLASFIRSMGAFSGFTIVMSTIIGLLYGIYMPMVNLPGSVIFVGNLMPATHMAALFRQILCSGPLEQVFLPEDAAIFNKDMGVDIYLGDFQFDALSSLLYALGISALFFIASVLLMRAKRES